MQPWISILINTIGSRELLPHIKTAGAWLKPSGLATTTRNLHFQIGEIAYLASRRHSGGTVQAIVAKVFCGNPGDRTSTISTFSLEYPSRKAYLVSDVAPSRGRASLLTTASGHACRVPARPWLSLPARLDPDGAVTGWIGFALIDRGDLTLGEASRLAANLVAVLSDGTELRTGFPLYEETTPPRSRWHLPRLSLSG